VKRSLLLLCAAVVLFLLVPPAQGSQGARPQMAETVVTFTFDGTYKGQEAAAQILSDNQMAGTFYINSGYLGYPAYLSVEDLRSMVRGRNELGGASLFGNDLSRLPVARARTEICDDRMTLAQLGFQTTSFAYPYGASTPQVKSLAQSCGYNSGREVAGLYQSESDCSSCPKGETLPPTDDFRIRTAEAGLSLADLKAQVRRAELFGGGWVPLVFAKVGVDPNHPQQTISPEDFAALVHWVAHRPTSTRVETVDQVMGGPLKAVTGTPLRRLVPDPSTAIGTPTALSHVPAWTILGFGVGQAQILMLGCAMAVAAVLSFRLVTRGDRYARD
jgi:peptidoglycan/xylan/chitin deacetylase (PgdA/CDA1 family)